MIREPPRRRDTVTAMRKGAPNSALGGGAGGRLTSCAGNADLQPGQRRVAPGGIGNAYVRNGYLCSSCAELSVVLSPYG